MFSEAYIGVICVHPCPIYFVKSILLIYEIISSPRSGEHLSQLRCVCCVLLVVHLFTEFLNLHYI